MHSPTAQNISSVLTGLTRGRTDLEHRLGELDRLSATVDPTVQHRSLNLCRLEPRERCADRFDGKVNCHHRRLLTGLLSGLE